MVDDSRLTLTISNHAHLFSGVTMIPFSSFQVNPESLLRTVTVLYDFLSYEVS